MIEDANVKIIAKAGFGFGDVNSCMIFKKWEE
jgi:3-oxoacyl-(acyl-carrier-protein) synthase